MSFPKARLDRDKSVDRVLHPKRVPLKYGRKRKRPTISNNFDDDYDETDNDEQTTEVSKMESNIVIHERPSKESLNDNTSTHNYNWSVNDMESRINASLRK